MKTRFCSPSARCTHAVASSGVSGATAQSQPALTADNGELGVLAGAGERDEVLRKLEVEDDARARAAATGRS